MDPSRGKWDLLNFNVEIRNSSWFNDWACGSLCGIRRYLPSKKCFYPGKALLLGNAQCNEGPLALVSGDLLIQVLKACEPEDQILVDHLVSSAFGEEMLAQ